MDIRIHPSENRTILLGLGGLGGNIRSHKARMLCADDANSVIELDQNLPKPKISKIPRNFTGCLVSVINDEWQSLIELNNQPNIRE